MLTSACGETGRDDGPVAFARQAADGGAEAVEVDAAGRRTLETVKGGERIMEALDVLEEERGKWELHEAEKRALAPGTKIAPPKPHPLLQATKMASPEQYVLHVVGGVPSAELEEALLVLSLSYVTKLLACVDVWFSKVGRAWRALCVGGERPLLTRTHAVRERRALCRTGAFIEVAHRALVPCILSPTPAAPAADRVPAAPAAAAGHAAHQSAWCPGRIPGAPLDGPAAPPPPAHGLWDVWLIRAPALPAKRADVSHGQDMVGFNLAALQFLRRDWEASASAHLFAAPVSLGSEIKRTKLV